MGSALSLFNTTPDTWLLKIMLTPWNWSSLPTLAEAVVTHINRSLAPLDSQLRLLPNYDLSTPSNFFYDISGMTPAIRRGMLAMANLSEDASWASAFSIIASSYSVQNESCVSTPPGSSLRKDGVTLSLIHRGLGYSIRVSPTNSQKVTMHLLEMYPIFSGPGANTTNVYNMQDWINNNSLTGCLTIGMDAASLMAFTSDTSMGDDWLQEFTKVRLKAKEKALQEAGKDRDAAICEEDTDHVRGK